MPGSITSIAYSQLPRYSMILHTTARCEPSSDRQSPTEKSLVLTWAYFFRGLGDFRGAAIWRSRRSTTDLRLVARSRSVVFAHRARLFPLATRSLSLEFKPGSR